MLPVAAHEHLSPCGNGGSDDSVVIGVATACWDLGWSIGDRDREFFHQGCDRADAFIVELELRPQNPSELFECRLGEDQLCVVIPDRFEDSTRRPVGDHR